MAEDSPDYLLELEHDVIIGADDLLEDLINVNLWVDPYKASKSEFTFYNSTDVIPYIPVPSTPCVASQTDTSTQVKR